MARPLRIEYDGAWYHVMNRRTGRQPVFRNDEQRRYFLALLGNTSERFNAEWHAYCLMGNHYHLLVRTPEANLQRIMRHINGELVEKRQNISCTLSLLLCGVAYFSPHRVMGSSRW